MLPTTQLISALISKTKNKKIYWEYLSKFPKLELIIHNIINENDLDIDFFEEDSSFYIQYKNGFFALISSPSGTFLFALPAIDAKVKAPLNSCFDYQSDLVRLVNLAIKQHPNLEDFIDDFLNSAD